MTEDRAGTIHLAAFGKHPGWDDHIDDIGMCTEQLVQVKSWLYTAGVRDNLDRGEWDRLTESQRLEGFRHVFVWHMPAAVIVGRLWSSRDGKGREQYPMVVCAHCKGLSSRWAIRHVLPRLQHVEEACLGAATAQEMRALMDSFQSQLHALAKEEADLPEPSPGPGPLAQLADRPEFSPDHEGLCRLLYQIGRNWGEYRVYMGMYDEGNTHWSVRLEFTTMRVPACGESAGQVLAAWSAFLDSIVQPDVPALVLYRLDETWADLFAGVPNAAAFRCLRVSPAGLPLVTDIPYSVDPPFIAAVQAEIEASRRGELPAKAAAPRSVAQPGPKAPGRIRSFFGRLFSPSNRKTLLAIAGGAAGLVLLLAVILPSLMSGSRQPVPPRMPGQPDRALTEDETAAWQALCHAYFDWFGIIHRRFDQARREMLAGDEDLRPVLALLDDALARGIELDPRLLARAPDTPVQALLANPPPGARTEEGIARWRQALERIREIESALAQWPGLRSLADEWEARGWSRRAKAVRTCADGVNPAAGTAIFDAIGKVIELKAAMKPVTESWNQLSRRVALLELHGKDTPAAGFGKYALAQAGDMAPAGDVHADLAALAETLRELTSFSGQLADYLQGPWHQTVERELALKDQRLPATTDDAPTREALLAFLKVAADYERLRDDPRGKPDDWSRRLAEVDRLLDEAARTGVPQLDPLRQARAGAAEAVRAMWEIAPIAMNRPQLKAGIADNGRRLDQLAERTGIAMIAVLGDADAFLRGAVEPSVVASQALKRFHVEQARAILGSVTAGQLREKPGQWYNLKTRIDALAEAVRAIDADIAPSLPTTDAGPAWITAHRAATEGRREEAVIRATQVYAKGVAAGEPVEVIRRGWQGEAKSYLAWRDEARGLIEGMMSVERRLNSGVLLDEPVADQPATAATVKAWRANPLFADLHRRAGNAGRAVIGRIEALEVIAGSENVDDLQKLAAQVKADQPEVALASWRRLGDLKDRPWPASAKEWAAEQASRASLAAWAAELAPPRREAIGTELNAAASQRWIRCFSLLQDEKEIDALAPTAAELAIPLDALDARSRFNLILFEARAAASKPPKDEAELRRHIAALRDRFVRHLDGKADGLQVAGFVAGLGEMAAAKPDQFALDVNKAGPASAGWSATIESDTRVTYAKENIKLAFVLIDPGRQETPAFFIQTTEMSIEQFGAAASGLWKDLKDNRFIAEQVEDLRGPCGWTWSRTGEGIEARDRWLKGLALAEGLKVEPPRRDHPMQRVSPQAALLSARQVGCRLPTSAEWKAATAASPEKSPNLRDATWRRQLTFVAGLPADKPAPWPDADIFWPKDVERLEGRSARAPGDADDGMLLFHRVGEGSDAAVRHLAGNVAEYVFDQPEPAMNVTNARQCNELFQKHDHLRIIGGSAMSAPSVAIDQPQSLVRLQYANLGFSDVGFRLAFTAPRVPLATQFNRLLSKRSYLPPPAPQPSR